MSCRNKDPLADNVHEVYRHDGDRYVRMKVPFIDLKAQYRSIRDEIAVVTEEVLNSASFAGGAFVERFEEKFAKFCQCEYAIGVGSGTEALWLTLLALGVGQGDEVVTVPNTFIGTVEAISFSGAKPVFVDIEQETYTMDPVLLESAITRRTKAIIPVHLYGQMADMDSIIEIARAYGLSVIEDACQAHGAEYKGRPAGSIGDAGCFSFYPGKNLGAYGEAGAIVTNDPKLNQQLRMLRDHGQAKKYHHSVIGWNSRMDGLQGAVLGVKLNYLRSWNNARRKNAQLYRDVLANLCEVVLPREAPYGKHVYHIFPIRFVPRDDLIQHLRENGIDCGIHYPIPVHLQKAYQFLGLATGSFPVSERIANELISLPMYPELMQVQIAHIATTIEDFVARKVIA